MEIAVRRPGTKATSEEFSAFVGPHLHQMAIVATRFGPIGAREDVVQDSLLRAWRSWLSYQPDRGTPAAWLCAITANVARSHARRVSARAAFSLGTHAVHQLELDAGFDLDRAIRQLSRRQQEAISCYYAVGLSTAETAVVMNCSEGTVKSTLADARSRLRALLGATYKEK